MNDKKRIFILLKSLDKIRQDNEETINGTERPITTNCKEDGISFEQIFYLYVILMLH